MVEKFACIVQRLSFCLARRPADSLHKSIRYPHGCKTDEVVVFGGGGVSCRRCDCFYFFKKTVTLNVGQDHSNWYQYVELGGFCQTERN